MAGQGDIRARIAKGEVDQAIILTKQLIDHLANPQEQLDDLLNIQAQKTYLEKQIQGGILSVDEQVRINNKIISSLLTLLSTIRKKQQDGAVRANKLIPEYQLYTCNRQEQVNQFDQHLLASTQQAAEVFVIHGDEEESPHGLYRRFCENEIRLHARSAEYLMEPIHLSPSEDLQYFQICFLRALYQSLKLQARKIIPAKESIRSLYHSPLFQNKEYVTVGVKLYSYEWKSTIIDLIKWFINTYCRVAKDPNDPRLIFIIQLNYRPEQPVRKSLFSLFSKNKGAKTELAIKFNTIQQIKVLSSLQSVKVSDINSWLDCISHNTSDKDRLIRTHFNSKSEYSMSEVEQKLKTIIQQHNQANFSV